MAVRRSSALPSLARCCDRITSAGLTGVLAANPCVHTLRCGGTAASDRCVRRALPHLVPSLRGDAAEGSWEEVDVGLLGRGALAMRWMVWVSGGGQGGKRYIVF